MKEKRISFGEYDAARIYEWRLAMNQGMRRDKCLLCCEMCVKLEKRLEDFIGKKETRHLQKLVADNPYFS